MQDFGKRGTRRMWRGLSTLSIGAVLLCLTGTASAKTIHLAQEYGIAYLPLMVMQHNGLIQKYARADGITDLKVKWATFGSGAAMNAALLAGDLDFASGGTAPLLQIWDKTKGSYNVRGVAAMDSLPYLLNTTDPALHTLSDISNTDRIALPAVGVSIQAITLEKAAAEQWGITNYAKLNHLTVSMEHPVAMAALLSGHGEVNCHFANAPYQEEELKRKNVHTVLTSEKVWGGPSTLELLWTTEHFHNRYPKLYSAVFEALQSAEHLIRTHAKQAATIYLTEQPSHVPTALIEEIIKDHKEDFTTTPQRVEKIANFMHQIGSISHLPASWKALFFSAVWSKSGS